MPIPLASETRMPALREQKSQRFPWWICREKRTVRSWTELLHDGTFVTTTYGHWAEGEPPYIVSIRFTIEQFDAAVAKKR